MTLKEKLLRIISERREENKVEFKETIKLDSAQDKAELAKLVMAIANSRGWDGYIIIGVKDRRNCPSNLAKDYVSGFSSGDQEGFERMINQILAEYCDPIITIRYEEFVHPEVGKPLGVIIIPRSGVSRPHLARRDGSGIQRGTIYIRRGGMVERATRDEIDRMIKRGEKAVMIINFAHPFVETMEEIERIIGCRVEEIFDRPAPKLSLEDFESEIDRLIEGVPLSSEEWQTCPLIINVPTYHLAAVTLIAKLHGIMGHFPSIFYVFPEAEGGVTTYRIKKVVNLQEVRDRAREGR